MNIKITMAVMATAFALTACGNIKNDIPGRETTPGGTLTATEAREKGFERIETYGKFNVFFVQGDKTSVELRGDSEQIARTEIKCDGRTLTFSMRRRSGFHSGGSGDVDVYVTSPRLSGVSLNGSGDFKSESELRTDGIDISISGAGDVELRSLDCGKCNVVVSGSGDIGIDRIAAKELVVKIAGSGDIDLSNANIDRADLSIAGSGDIDIAGHVGSVSRHIAGLGTIDINP